MEIKARDVYNSALAIMNERDSEHYSDRALPILNTLIGQCWAFSEEHDYGAHSHWKPLTQMDNVIDGVDISLGLSAMPYGLAGMLYIDEDPVRAGSWWDIWQEGVAMFKRNRPAEFEEIVDIYGGICYRA